MEASSKVKIMIKVQKVITSCKTLEQLEVAKNYLELYRNKYPSDTRSYFWLLESVSLMRDKLYNAS